MPYLTPDALPEGDTLCRPLFIPNDPRIVWAVSGALLELTREYNWQPFGAVTPAEIASAMLDMLAAYFTTPCPSGGDSMALGTVFPFLTTDPPAGSVECDGQEYADTDYPGFWSVVSDDWKTDSTHWAPPDVRNNFIVGAGDTYAAGDTGGEASHTLTLTEMPAHDGHSHFTVNTPLGTMASYAQNTPQGSIYGGGQAHENRPPFVALRWAVQVQ